MGLLRVRNGRLEGKGLTDTERAWVIKHRVILTLLLDGMKGADIYTEEGRYDQEQS